VAAAATFACDTASRAVLIKKETIGRLKTFVESIVNPR